MIFKQMGRFLNGKDELERKIFWTIELLMVGMTLLAFIATILEKIGTAAVIMAGLCTLVPIVILFVVLETGAFSLGFMIESIMISAVLLPITFFTNGGLHSAMPIYCMGGLVACGFCVDRKKRVIAFVTGFTVQMAAFIIAHIHPELVIPMRESLIEMDIISGFFILAVMIVLMQSLILDEYKTAIAKAEKEVTRKTEFRLELMDTQKENFSDVKRMRHDMRHHNALILEFAENGDLEGLKKYIRQKMEFDEYYATKIYCMNAVINNVFTVFTRKAQRAGITVNIKADVMNDIPFGEPELMAIFSNTFENAMHGAMDSGKDDRRIDIDVYVKNQRLVFKCANTCSDQIQLTDGFPTARIGTGINSMLNAAEEYDGTVSYKIENGMVRCTVILLFRNGGTNDADRKE